MSFYVNDFGEFFKRLENKASKEECCECDDVEYEKVDDVLEIGVV